MSLETHLKSGRDLFKAASRNYELFKVHGQQEVERNLHSQGFSEDEIGEVIDMIADEVAGEFGTEVDEPNTYPVIGSNDARSSTQEANNGG